jgi:hypothetical protein
LEIFNFFRILVIMSTKIERISHQLIIDSYLKTKEIKGICDEFKISEPLVKKILNQHNIPIIKKRHEFNSLDHKLIIKEYHQIRDIEIVAKKYDVSVTLIDKILKTYKIPRKKRIYPSDEDIISTYHITKKQFKTAEILNCSEYYIDKILDKYNIRKFGTVNIGDKFNRFTVIGVNEPGRTSGGQSKKMLICKCDCGSIRRYSSASLRSGKKTSCGCIMKEKSTKRQLKLLNKKIITPEEKKEREKRKQEKLKEQERRRKQLEKKYESIRHHVGDKINRWTILSNETRPESESIKNNDTIKLQCECGVIKTRKAFGLKSSISCGCYQKERSSKIHNIHFIKNDEHDKMYNRWKNMKARCYNIMHQQYINYGMRGITICDRWMEPNGKGFINFCQDMGPRPGPSYSIDRINNDGNYDPSNCQWATALHQSRNQRRYQKMKSPPIPF